MVKVAQREVVHVSLRLLVVDDDPHVCELVTLYAQKEGYDTTCVGDGEAALTHMLQQPHDLIILDVMLPNIDGFQVCRRLRSEQAAWVPIILLTARDEESDRVLGLELGADDYVTKPFSPRELMARVKAVLRRNQHGQAATGAAPFHVAGMTVDPITRTVTVQGEQIQLTPREFDLLAQLVAHPRRIFRREQLLERIWGIDYYGDDRTVDVHIRRLRAKLPEAAAAQLQTVWGVGYRFAPAEE